jgi:hypothetical protein
MPNGKKTIKRIRLMNGSVNADNSHDYKSAVIDAIITTGFTFFSTLSAAFISGDTKLALTTAAIASGISFFASLMVSLNIKKPTIPT